MAAAVNTLNIRQSLVARSRAAFGANACAGFQVRGIASARAKALARLTATAFAVLCLAVLLLILALAAVVSWLLIVYGIWILSRSWPH
jgi:hypothetical protein